MTIKRLLSLTLALALGASLLSGCAKGGGSSSASAASARSSATEIRLFTGLGGSP